MDKNLNTNNRQDIKEIAEKLSDIKKRSLSDYTFIKGRINRFTEKSRENDTDYCFTGRRSRDE